jgi:hypothetical protein
MRHSIRPWLDWVMTDLLALSRPRPHGQPFHVRYEKAGLTLAGSPVPWNAESVVVEFVLKLPTPTRVRSDFALRVPGSPPIPAELLKKDDKDDRVFRLFFRLPQLPETTGCELLWRNRLVTTIALTVQSADQFLASLRLANPTVAVKIGGRSVAATTFVGSQCRGITAAAVVRSPTSLAPLADLGLTVAFRSDRKRVEHVVPVALTASQLAAKEVLVTASPPKFPRHSGDYTVTWRAGGRTLHAHRVTAVTGTRFAQSLRVSDSRFVATDHTGLVRVLRQPPPAGKGVRFGPCFVIASREAGAAGLVELAAVAVTTGGEPTATAFKQAVLVTDGLTAFAPGLVEPDELTGATGFELRHKARVLSLLSFRPVPAAATDAEGAFRPPPEFAWSNAAEDELADRLIKLMRGPDLPGVS